MSGRADLNEIIYVSWEESELGWGVRPDGCSLHLSLQDAESFERDYWDRMKECYGKEVPEEYSRPAGRPVTAFARDELYEKIRESGNGIRLNFSEREEVKEGRLVYGQERSGWVSVTSS